jgi:hypothetical protein
MHFVNSVYTCSPSCNPFTRPNFSSHNLSHRLMGTTHGRVSLGGDGEHVESPTRHRSRSPSPSPSTSSPSHVSLTSKLSTALYIDTVAKIGSIVDSAGKQLKNMSLIFISPHPSFSTQTLSCPSTSPTTLTECNY